MFGGAAFGLAPVVGVVGGMAGSTVAVIKQPIAPAFIILMYVPPPLYGAMIAAIAAGTILLRAVPPAQFPQLQEGSRAASAAD
jgi:hypothetical protein